MPGICLVKRRVPAMRQESKNDQFSSRKMAHPNFVRPPDEQGRWRAATTGSRLEPPRSLRGEHRAEQSSFPRKSRSTRHGPGRTLSAGHSGRVSAICCRGESLTEVLEALFDPLPEEPNEVISVALEILRPLAWDDKKVLPDDPRCQRAIWRALELGVQGGSDQGHTWGRMLERMAQLEPETAMQIAIAAATSGDYFVADEAADELRSLISKNPTLLLKHLSPVLLSSEGVGALAAGPRGDFMHAFSDDVLKEWVEQNGVAAARVIALHLLPPYVDQGKLMVPPLTEFVLKKFEDDGRVFSSFCSGLHTGKVYVGDIAAQHEAAAELSEKFCAHPLRRVREWADLAASYARRSAQSWREHHEEDLES